MTSYKDKYLRTKMTNRNFIYFTAFVLVVHVLLATIYANNQIVSDDQWRLLADGYEATLNGYYAVTGDILPGVGPTIGSIPTVITAISLLINGSPLSPMITIIILRIVAFLLILLALKPYLSNKTLAWFTVFFLLSPWVLYETKLSQESMFLFGSSIIFYALLMLRKYGEIYDEYNNKILISNGNFLRNFVLTLVLIIGIGFSFQISYITLAFVILTILLLIRGIINFSLAGFVVGLTIVLGSYIPFVVQLNQSPELALQFFNNDDYNIGFGAKYIYPMLKTIVDWIRLGSTVFSHYLVQGFNPIVFTTEPVAKLIFNLWICIIYIVGSITFLLNLGANLYMFKHITPVIFAREKIYKKQTFLLLTCFFAFISVLITAALLPISFPALTLSVFLPFALIPALLLIDLYSNHSLKLHMVSMISIAILLVIINIFGAVSSAHFSNDESFISQIEHKD